MMFANVQNGNVFDEIVHLTTLFSEIFVKPDSNYSNSRRV